MVPMWMFPVAIACGNAFILKPVRARPGASMLLAELWAEAGLPDGVFRVVHGDKEAVDALLTTPTSTRVSFVGLDADRPLRLRDGGQRRQARAGTGRRQEPHGRAARRRPRPAADAAVSAGYGSAGERCMAISVVVAVDPIGDELVEQIADRIADLKIGDGSEPGVDMGPLITEAHRDRVAGYVGAGADAGATLVVDGRGLTVDDRPDGFCLGPDAARSRHDRHDRLPRRDLRARCSPWCGRGSYDEAVRLVNENLYGNGVALFTRDGGAARRFQFEVEAGMVGINVPIPVPMAYYSFGGWNRLACSATPTCTAPRASTSTRGARWLRADGPTPRPEAPISASRPTPERRTKPRTAWPAT